MQVKYDFSGLNKALAQKAQFPKNALSDILQDAALKVLIGSRSAGGEMRDGLVGLTRKATKERIKSDQQVMVAGKNGEMRPRLIWEAIGWLKGRGMQITRAAVSESAKLILKMRIKSRAYIAAGWLWCARDLHEKSPYLQKKHKLTRLKARNMPMVDKASNGTAAQSFSITQMGEKQSSVTLYNTSRGGDTVGMEYVQQAINNATADIQEYLDKKVVMAVLMEVTKNGNFVYS